MKDRYTVVLAAFAILERDGKILLGRRKNTGYADGKFQMPAGHTEVGEYPKAAAIREAMEEVGVEIAPEDAEFVHVSHRLNRVDDVGDYVDFFFLVRKWKGEPKICEPDKCAELVWAPWDNLPEDTIESIRKILGSIREGNVYSENVDRG